MTERRANLSDSGAMSTRRDSLNKYQEDIDSLFEERDIDSLFEERNTEDELPLPMRRGLDEMEAEVIEVDDSSKNGERGNNVFCAKHCHQKMARYKRQC